MDEINIGNTWVSVIITYIDNIIDEEWFIRSRNKYENWTISPSHWLVNRVSDLMNNNDLFLEYANSFWTDSILAKNSIQYVTLWLIKNDEIINPENENVTIELVNWQKFQWEIDMWGVIKIKHLFENKSFIPLIQPNINRILLVNRNNIKKIEIQKKLD